MIVVDASVLATALGDDGPDGDRARARLRGERLSAPELLDLEVASVLRRQVQGGEVDIRRAALALADLAALPLRRAPHRPLLARCWELRDNLTVYDASYVALAEALDVTLLTGGRRLARAPGPRCRIEMLRSASLSAAFASFLACRDVVCRITVCLACGSRSSEPRDRASGRSRRLTDAERAPGQSGQAVLCCRDDHVLPHRAGLGAGGAGSRVNVDLPHARRPQRHRAVERFERRGAVAGALRAIRIARARVYRTAWATSAADSASTTTEGRWSTARFHAWRAWS